MENLIHKITIREWSYYSKSGDISGLKKHGFNTKNIDSIIAIVDENLGETKNLGKDIQRLNSKYKIQELLVYYKNLRALLDSQLKAEAIQVELGITLSLDDSLNKAIDAKSKRLNDKYGISVNTLSDMQKIDSEIQRRLDKYAEMNKVIPIGEGITFAELVISIFKILGYEKIDYEMVLSDFFILKKQASKQVK